MVKRLVIADDLTGALDTAVQFVADGHPVLVLTDMAAFRPEDAAVESLVIDTESRHFPPRAAAQRVCAAAKLGLRSGAVQFYKKIDSTLRGNIGAELAGLLVGCSGDELILAPSFPCLGRTVRGGRLYVHGIPLAETAVSRDPLDPVMTGDVAAIIARQTKIPVKLLAQPQALPPRHEGNKTIYLFDAETDDDLRRLSLDLAARDRLHLAAGCAGFAKVLADLAGPQPQPRHVSRGSLPMLIINGSLHEVSRRQIDFAARLDYPRLSLNPHELIGQGKAATAGLRYAKRVVIDSLQQGQSSMLEVNNSSTGAPVPGGEGSLSLSQSLGRLVKEIIDESGQATLVIFGGDTAIGILNALQVQRLSPQTEIVPGVVALETVTENHLHLITKAGGFGSDDLIAEIASWLKG